MKWEIHAAKYSTRRTFIKIFSGPNAIEADTADEAREIAQKKLRSGYTIQIVVPEPGQIKWPERNVQF